MITVSTKGWRVKQTSGHTRELNGQVSECVACTQGRGLGEFLAGLKDQRVMRRWSMIELWIEQTVLSLLNRESQDVVELLASAAPSS